MSTTDGEKGEITPVPQRTSTSGSGDVKLENAEDAFEVFKRDGGKVDFRTVGWIQASVIFLKRTYNITPEPFCPATNMP
jgi:hypothetical protein